MKLVLAIVNNDDSAVVASALTQEGFFCNETFHYGRIPDGGQCDAPDRHAG